MIQRYLFTALQQGLAAIALDPTILDELFSNLYALDSPELIAIKKFFVETPPTIYHGYARTDYQFPLYSIVLKREGESQMFIGDEAGIITDEDDPEYGSDAHAAIWKHQYDVLCVAKHPDASLYLYEVAKAIILEAFPYLIDQNIWAIKVSGSDLHPESDYLPAYLFTRVLTFECEHEFNQTIIGSKLGKAFRVTGIFGDEGGTLAEVGGVKTLVTLYGM